MTDNKRVIAILSITSILIFSGFGYSPFAYSTGSWSGGDKDWDDWKDWKKWKEEKKHKENNIESGLCNSPDNLILNGCFESPDVNTDEDWDIYPSSEPLPSWEAVWVNPDACVGYPSEVQNGQLELQEGILGGPAEGTQHAELDSDCNGPDGPSGGEELTSVIISQSTIETTTPDDEYVITFAYKGRPGKNLPLSTNGLSVEWNDADVTPDLKFSKKKWKYASITVNGILDENNNPIPSVLKFTDTGNSDTLGTFLDDVSVIKVPKPVVTVILTKEIDNSADPTNPLVIEDPEEFNITLYKDGNMVPNTQIGEDNPNIFPNVDSEGAIFKITEDATNYVATVEGDGCPNVNDNDPQTGEVLLQPGDTLTCHILNTFVPPPTITLKKVITQDNTDEANELADTSSFSMFITDVGLDGMPGTGDEGTPIEIVEEKQVVSPGTYTISETSPENFEFVLITGDTGCPTMVEDMEAFTLESGQHLTCVIYNDDDADASSGGTGVAFGFNGFEWNKFIPGGPSPPPGTDITLNVCTTTTPVEAGCVEKRGINFFVIVDDELDLENNSIITWSLTGVGIDPDISPATGVQPPTHTCALVGIFTSETTFDVNPDRKGFGLLCNIMSDINWNINYAFIETI